MLPGHVGHGRTSSDHEYWRKRVVAEPTEVLEDIFLDEDNPKRCTRIGADLEEKIKKDLVQFLKKTIDVFAWIHEDMSGRS